MYKDLPKLLQEKIKKYLMSNQFRKAKALHDAWIAQKKEADSQHRRAA